MAVIVGGKPGEGSMLYLGTPSPDGRLLSTECLAPVTHSRLLHDGMGLFELRAPEREQLATAISVVQLPDESTCVARTDW